MEGDLRSYQWIPTREMWSDGLTKEIEMAEGLRKMMKTGVCELKNDEVNKVMYENDEVKMLNIGKRKRSEEDQEEGRVEQDNER